MLYYDNISISSYGLREFACLTTVILAPLRMEWGLHAGSATSLPRVPLVPRMPRANYRSMVFFVRFAREGPFFVPDRCIPSAISFSETVLSVNCRGYANFWLHANLKKRTSRGGILWRWQASMSSENSAIRDLKKGTGSDRGHLTKKRSHALCQKVVIC